MVPPSVIAHAEEIRRHLLDNELGDVRIEITVQGVTVQRMEPLSTRRYRGIRPLDESHSVGLLMERSMNRTALND